MSVCTLEECHLLGCNASGSCKNRLFGGTYRLYLQGEINQRTRDTLAVTSNFRTLVCYLSVAVSLAS
jgi:hypothetical protein